MSHSPMSWRGAGALFSGIVLFSTIEVASKLMQLGGAEAGRFPFWLAFFRFIITGLVLLVPSLNALRARSMQMARRDWAELAALGFLGVTVMSGLFHLAITYLPANVAALVFSCNPVFVMLFAPLVLPERITLRKLSAVALCLVGIGVLARDRTDGVSVTGLVLMLAAIVIFGIYTVWFKKITPRYGALPVTGLAGLFGGIFLLPLSLLLEGWPLAQYGAADWVGILYLALVGTALGYFLFIYGIGHVEASVGSMAFFLKPFLAALFAWIVLREPLTVPILVGGGLILGGMCAALIRPPVKRKGFSTPAENGITPCDD